MRTLFNENILSPSPTPTPTPQLERSLSLSFPSTASNVSSSAASFHSNPYEHAWLTQQYQAPHQHDADQDRHSSAHYHARRKGSPSLLFMGHRRSGKSSIRQVVFEKLSPADTLFLEPTANIEYSTLQSFVPITAAELPLNLQNQITSPDGPGDFNHAPIFSTLGSLIWVLDVQDEYHSAITALLDTAVFLATHYPRTSLDVFIHKTDGLSDEYKNETFREVRQRVADELADLGFGERQVSYYQTSIFDPSVFEAVSKVVQKLLPPLPAMEALLTRLCGACRVQKAYLFDTGSKLYVATDASPTFPRDYEVCSDYVDVIVDIKQLYGGWRQKGTRNAVPQGDEQGEEASTYDANAIAESMITYDKSGDTYIYAREINEHLMLMCVMGRGSSVEKRALVDYNVAVLHEALLKVLDV